MRIILSAIIVLLLSFNAWSQGTHFGLYAELLRNQDIITNDDTYFSDIESKNNIGLSVGTSLHFHPEHRTSFRLAFGLGYLSRKVEFTYRSRPVEDDPLLVEGKESIAQGAIFLKIPAHMVFKPQEGSGFGIVAGATPSLNVIGGNARSVLKYKRTNVTVDAGINYSFQVNDKLTITPELKYSHSLIDAIDGGSDFYTDSIDRYLRNNLALTVFITW